MAFFERAKQTLSEAGKELGQRANGISSTAKFTLKLKEAEKRLNDAYALLGRQIMEENEEAVKDLAPDMVLYIKQKMEEINDLKMQMEEAKKNGKCQCPSCGRTIGADSRFCEYCGARVDTAPVDESKPEEQVEEAEIIIQDDIMEESVSSKEQEEEVILEESKAEEKISEQEIAQEDEVIVEEIQMKTCPGCGNKIQIGDMFCIYCGMKL